MSLTTLDIKEPGLSTLPPGVERYVVEGGGLTGIQILLIMYLSFPIMLMQILKNKFTIIFKIIKSEWVMNL